MSDTENLLAEKVSRPPEEVGREVYRLLREHGPLRVELRENGYDVRITPAEASGEDERDGER